MGPLTESEQHQLQGLRQMQPVILLGMHRSGTSLMARLLRDVGIHMGSWLSRDAEAVFFQRLNRRIYGAVHVKWGYVDPLVEAMGSEQFIELHTNAILKAFLKDRYILRRDVGIAQFFGREVWDALCRGEDITWGWKDPRTTLTFPIWARIFPQARWVHVVRNGIDVAISTHRRSKKQQRKLRNRFFRIDYCPITLDFGYCFRLWETYVSFVLDHKYLIPPDQYYEMRYEDLLAEPQVQLRRLLAFLDYRVEDEVLLAACERINRSRLDNSAYAAEYSHEIPSLVVSSLMQQLDYGYNMGSTTK